MAKDSSLPILLGAAAAFLFLGKGGGSADCSQVGPDGGTVAGIKYYEFRTPGASQGDELPMLIVFHSLGTADSFLISAGKSRVNSTKGPVRVIVPASPRTIGTKKLYSWFGSLRAGSKDQAALSEMMQQAGREMNDFISQITRCLPTKGKPVVSGTSQGGSMAYLMATLYPRRVSGAAPLAGWLPKDLWDTNMAPTIAGHGTQDDVVDYENTAEYWSIMDQYGAPIRYKSFNTGHNVKGGMWGYMNNAVNELLGYA
jgi:predicted esterase